MSIAAWNFRERYKICWRCSTSRFYFPSEVYDSVSVENW